MFVQVIKGRTSDSEGLQRQGQRWLSDVRPDAIGYLGGTFGIADDGTFVVLARFEDESSARANSERPEQQAWWDETARLIDGEPTFRESSDVTTLFGGGSDDAGFVQVMEGTVSDRAKAEAWETPERLEELHAARRDLLGAVRVWQPDGTFVEAAYFTSEEDAREGETSSEFAGPQQEYAELFGEMTFIDLRRLQLS
jgi:hypothetical protein